MRPTMTATAVALAVLVTGAACRPATKPQPEPTASSAPAAPTRRAQGLTAKYVLGPTSDAGYEATIQIATMVPVTGWSAVLTLPDGVTAVSARQAEFQQSGRTLTLTPKPWNDTVSRGQTITIGFRVSGTGQPTSCQVNGVTCAK